MKIIRLAAENVKRLKAVEIRPDGSTVLITGRNGQGKTSVLDAIWYALGGKEAAKDTPQPIRRGQKKAHVELDLGEIRVTRAWTEKGSYLKVENAEGASYASPQKLLDDLVGRLSFDPLAFVRARPADQVAMLRDATGIDTGDLESAAKTAYDERTATNRDVRRLEGVLASLPPVAETGIPAEEVSLAEIGREIADARAVRKGAEAERRKLEAFAVDVLDAEKRITDLSRQLNEWREKLARATVARDAQQATVEALVLPDVEGLEARLVEAEDLNRQIRAANQRADVTAELLRARQYAQELTDRITSLEEERRALVASAPLPVEGLSWGEDGVALGDLPFSQASSAEQLRVSVAVAMAANPKLRVLRITDGSLLDAESLSLIEALADAEDYQVWIEMVDASGNLGIYIEDGEVRVPEPQPALFPEAGP